MHRTQSWITLMLLGWGVACGGRGITTVGELNRAVGDGGASVGSSTGGEGGEVDEVDDCEKPTGCVFLETTSDVTWVTSDHDTLYWTEYGSHDSLGNYEGNGRVRARTLESDAAWTIAEDLPGPTAVGVTTRDVVVFLDRAEHEGTSSVIARAPLAGGDVEIVLRDAELWWSSHSFTNEGDAAYFTQDGVVMKLAHDDAKPQQIASLNVVFLTVAGGSLYAAGDGVYRVPLDGDGDPKLVSRQDRHGFSASGDYLYGGEDAADGVYLTQMPLAGGAWKRVAPKYRGLYTWLVQIRDDRFAIDLHLKDGSWQLWQGSLGSGEAELAVHLPNADPHRSWTLTRLGLFWIDGRSIRFRRIPQP